ncbi:MAG: XRE family transcriptional regulator [Gammaproteobacteria bacterium]|nr:MAG: XRE family transcriptional regulator [Gammaproteobacteria bacterium]
MTPGNRHRRARKQNGLSLRELEARTDELGHKVSRNILSKIERGEHKHLTAEQVQVICRALNMSADWWFLGDQQPAYAIGKRATWLNPRDRQVILEMIDALRRITDGT